jgi:hypothetical protein
VSINQSSHFFNKANTVTNLSSWNFKVNQRPIFNFAPRGLEGPISMRYTFPEGVRNQMLITTCWTFKSSINNAFVCATKVGFTNEEPEEVELAFNSSETTGTTTANHSLLIAKIDNTITLNV